jgi:hypothetical protein
MIALAVLLMMGTLALVMMAEWIRRRGMERGERRRRAG